MLHKKGAGYACWVKECLGANYLIHNFCTRLIFYYLLKFLGGEISKLILYLARNGHFSYLGDETLILIAFMGPLDDWIYLSPFGTYQKNLSSFGGVY